MRNFFYRCVKCMAVCYAGFLCFFSFEMLVSEVPDRIYIREGEEARLDVHFPFVVSDFEANNEKSDKKLCSILGIIPFKEVAVDVVKGQEVYASGEIVGLYTCCDGVLVMDTCELEQMDGTLANPSATKVRKGDYILSMSGNKITKKEDIPKILLESKGEPVQMIIKRQNVLIETSITPILAKNNVYMLGIWVKDDLAGIGTITYVSPTGDFGALGHGMSNGENGDLLILKEGEVYNSSIIGIEKGIAGEAGEVKAVIQYGDKNHLGFIENNKNTGIYGELDQDDLNGYIENEKIYKVGYKQEIRTGKAQIISDISGEKKYYDINIKYIDYISLNNNKGIHIEVIDNELLALTGGIVQGMSGSPIIQDGKIIGAVTHVLVNDPTKGYGIFIEEMLNN